MGAVVAGKLEMRGISVQFSGVKALADVHFEVNPGRAHALIGANGAGKSTLMKVLSGAIDDYEGDIYIDGKPAIIRSPIDAKGNGIQMVVQEVDTALIPNLSVAENMMIDQIIHGMKGRHWMRWRSIHQEAKQVLERLGVNIPTRKRINELTLAEKQLVLIARSIARNSRYLILDEPTAPLSLRETDHLFRLVRQLKKEGIGIVFISHRLAELYDICEDVTVMRDGQVAINGNMDDVDEQKMIEAMLGRKMDEQFPVRNRTIGDVAYEVQGIQAKGVNDIRLMIRRGEIVGVTGLVGAGKSELCRALFGVSPIEAGKVLLEQKVLDLRSPYHAARSGIAFVPEERRREGVFVEESVMRNIVASTIAHFTKWRFWMHARKERLTADSLIEKLGIKTSSPTQKVKYLSGGNQQKVAIGKWLVREADVYVFDEPTKGVDVGAKRDIYEQIFELASRGKCVLYASSETAEIMGIADRIYVMFNGTIVKEVEAQHTSEEQLMLYSTGSAGGGSD